MEPIDIDLYRRLRMERLILIQSCCPAQKGKDNYLKRDRVSAVRFTAADIDALKSAAAEYRKKTGEMRPIR